MQGGISLTLYAMSVLNRFTAPKIKKIKEKSYFKVYVKPNFILDTAVRFTFLSVSPL